MKEKLPSSFSKFTEEYLLRHISKLGISEKKEIITSTTINAGKEQVWEVLTDFKEYPKWNPFLVQIDGTLNKEERNKVLIKVPGVDDDFFYYAIIKRQTPNQKLIWRSRLYTRELFAGRHIFEIKELAENKVVLTHQETYKGVMIYLADPAFFGKVKRGINAMDKALKKRAENLYNKYILSEN